MPARTTLDRLSNWLARLIVDQVPNGHVGSSPTRSTDVEVAKLANAPGSKLGTEETWLRVRVPPSTLRRCGEIGKRIKFKI